MTALHEVEWADEHWNQEQRDTVARYRVEHGEAWLGIVNRYPYSGPWLWKWDGGLVENFAAAFVIPKYDHALVTLLEDRDRAPWRPSEAATRVLAIFERIESLGGEPLVWR